MTCYGQVNNGSWCNEYYYTPSRDADHLYEIESGELDI